MKLNTEYISKLPEKVQQILLNADLPPSEKFVELTKLGYGEDASHKCIKKALTLANSVLLTSKLDAAVRDKIKEYFVSTETVPTIIEMRAWLLTHGFVISYDELVKDYQDVTDQIDKELKAKGSDGLYASFQHRRLSSEIENKFVDYLQEEGASVGPSDEGFCPIQLAVGVLVELEHTSDFDVAKEIAKDHLTEDAEYYGKFNFPEEAEEQIEKITLDDYEPTEVVEAVSGWKNRLGKALLRSGRLIGNKIDISVYPIRCSYEVSPLDSGVLISSDVDGLRLLKSNSEYYTSEQFDHLLSHSASTDKLFVIPTAINVKDQALTSMAIKTAEQYYKEGILTRKELVAVLMRENDFSEGEANVIADFWDRVNLNSRVIARVHLTSSGFVPDKPVHADCAMADLLNSIDALDNPVQATYFVAEETLKDGIPCNTAALEQEYNTETATRFEGLSINEDEETYEEACSGLDVTSVSELVSVARRAQ